MQLLFTFAFMPILLKSVKLHSGSLFAHLLVDYFTVQRWRKGGEYRSVIDWAVKNNSDTVLVCF